ncbi:hypothetical protein [Pseudonocardia spinosispora]|uniref:hypothetical protein n=1 Tax=Pseudonocardia spinosispora TaxID=103441 RepID=UPI0003F69D19|nr:hypothetical protein [Pseudonocardia spinosispora]
MVYATKLQATRKQLGYSAADTIALLGARAAKHSIPIMTATSLKTKLSRWENGHEGVGLPEYRQLFREIYGRTNAELGFPDEHIDSEAEELRSRLAIARTIDTATIDVFRSQIEHTRRVDRQFGGLTQLEQLRHHIDQVTALLTNTVGEGYRAELAGVLCEASALAGWLSLDRNAHNQAWQHHERAKHAAREAGSTALLAHATAQQAYILIDIGETALAAEHISHARTLADRESPLIRAWLAAAHGEVLAINGAADGARRAFDAANQQLPADPVDPRLPFLFLGDGHLQRWHGNALARLGDPDAIEHLAHALERMPADFVRARAGLLVDLAYSHAATGNRDAASTYARDARHLAMQIKSDRQLHRLGQLVLPGAA